MSQLGISRQHWLLQHKPISEKGFWYMMLQISKSDSDTAFGYQIVAHPPFLLHAEFLL